MNKQIFLLFFIACTLLVSCNDSAKPAATTTTTAVAEGELDRSILPIKEPIYAAITEVDARNAKAPARFEVKAPRKAPNVVIVLEPQQETGS